jgi:hypothetical protein
MFLLVDQLAFAMKFLLGGFWSYYPYAPKRNEDWHAAKLQRSAIVAALLLLIAVLDWKLFIFYPAEQELVLR